MANLVNLESVSVTRGIRTVLDGISLGVQTGDRIGVLGLNGSGKSTLLSVLAGVLPPDSGRVSTQGGTRIEVVTQAGVLPPGSTVRDVVLARFGDAEHSWAGDAGIRGTLDGLGLGGIGLDSSVDRLSGGERRRVALAAALVTDADLLVLDEPTNHLDIEAVAWLARHLLGRRTALVVVTHDRWFLDAVASLTWEVVDGTVQIREGGYSDWVFARADRLRLDRAAEERRKNLARKELAWLRRGAPARTSKPRYRIEAAEALIADVPEPRNTVELHSFARKRLGRDVFELKAVTAQVPTPAGPRTLLDDVDYLVGPGDRIGIVGINGSGKSTLLRLLVGALPPVRGMAKIGRTVKIGYLSQEVVELPGDLRLLEAVSQIAGSVDLGGKTLTAGQLAERFGFGTAQQWTRVRELSGGERRRLQLLRLLMAEPNVLVLDEPTNDLDTDTLAALEDLLDSWPGTLLVVSHDRYLIERVTDTVVALLGDGRITHLPGGVEEYLRRRRALNAEAVTVAGAPAATTEKIQRAEKPEKAEKIVVSGDVPSTGPDAAALRALRKDLQRLERRMESLQRKEKELHTRLTTVGSDFEAAAQLDRDLHRTVAERDETEAQWLELAEQLEQA